MSWEPLLEMPLANNLKKILLIQVFKNNLPRVSAISTPNSMLLEKSLELLNRQESNEKHFLQTIVDSTLSKQQ